MHENEPRHWHDDAAMNRADDRARTLYFQCARRADRPLPQPDTHILRRRRGVPGVTSLPLPGHTPGHSGYMITSGNQSLLIWGDIIHVPEVQVPRPEVTMAFDTDPDQAAATRKRPSTW